MLGGESSTHKAYFCYVLCTIITHFYYIYCTTKYNFSRDIFENKIANIIQSKKKAKFYRDILPAPMQSQVHPTKHVKNQICALLKISYTPISPLTFLTSHLSSQFSQAVPNYPQS